MTAPDGTARRGTDYAIDLGTRTMRTGETWTCTYSITWSFDTGEPRLASIPRWELVTEETP